MMNTNKMISCKRERTKRTTFSPTQMPVSSADIIANNIDLLTEILRRLPIKSLLKFKSVSKSLLSLISSPVSSRFLKPHVSSTLSGLFIHTHNNPLNLEYEFVALDSSHSSAPFRSLTFANDPLGIEIIQSCNGLLLCSTYRRRYGKSKYYVYNPTTKQYTVLPRLHRILGVTLAFDPSKSPHYKAVCVRKCSSHGQQFQIEIYSSNSGPWRISGSPFTTNGYVEFGTGLFFNGAVHWISNSGSSLYFNIDEEQLKEMPMPQIPDGWDERRIRYFRESQGHLFLVEIFGPNTQFDVLEMEMDYSGWKVKYHVDVDAIAQEFSEMVRGHLERWMLNYYPFKILYIGLGENGEQEPFMLLLIPGKILLFDLKTHSSKKICDFNPGGGEEEEVSDNVLCNVYHYVESLACV